MGTLFVCATPIGNLEDITLRVLRILGEVSLIACEDTRHTQKLLNRYEIKTPTTSYHQHNAHTKAPFLLEKLQSGINIALVSDAGLPGISDPGEELIALCHQNGVCVTLCPGATAGISALVLSGLPTKRFAFEGFLSQNKKERLAILDMLKNETRTMIFYEAPHRLLETLTLLQKTFGDRNATIVRELTKTFEERLAGNLSFLLEHFSQNPPRGEFVLVLEGRNEGEWKQAQIDNWLQMTIHEHVHFYENKGLAQKDAIKQTAKDRNMQKREVYAIFKEL